MGIGGALLQNPQFRSRILNGQKPVGPLKNEKPEQTLARHQNFGLMGAFAGPAAAQRMNEALRVRRSEVSPSTARQMNRKGG